MDTYKNMINDLCVTEIHIKKNTDLTRSTFFCGMLFIAKFRCQVSSANCNNIFLQNYPYQWLSKNSVSPQEQLSLCTAITKSPMETSHVSFLDTKCKSFTLSEIVINTCKCKTNTLPILMHQMHISTTQVSSVMLR
jgi:hypothetical protein